MYIAECASCSHAYLTVAERTLESDAQVDGFVTAILDRHRDDSACDVTCLVVRGADAAAKDKRAEPAAEGWNPSGFALPCNTFASDRCALSIDLDCDANKRRRVSIDEPGSAGKLDCCARCGMHCPDHVKRSICRMNARERDPVISGHLPWNARKRCGHAVAALFSSSCACALLTLLSGSPPSIRAISTMRVGPSSTLTSAVVTPPRAAFATTM